MAVIINGPVKENNSFPRLKKGNASGDIYYVWKTPTGKISAIRLRSGEYIDTFAEHTSTDYNEPITIQNKD